MSMLIKLFWYHYLIYSWGHSLVLSHSRRMKRYGVTCHLIFPCIHSLVLVYINGKMLSYRKWKSIWYICFPLDKPSIASIKFFYYGQLWTSLDQIIIVRGNYTRSYVMYYAEVIVDDQHISSQCIKNIVHRSKMAEGVVLNICLIHSI